MYDPPRVAQPCFKPLDLRAFSCAVHAVKGYKHILSPSACRRSDIRHVERNGYAFFLVLKAGIYHSRAVEHSLCGNDRIALAVLVAYVDYPRYSALDYRLAALVAGEQRGVERCAAQVGCGVENGVQLRVNDVQIFRFERCAVSASRENGIIAAARHAVVADRDYAFVRHYAAADPRRRILAALCLQNRHSHKIFVPG